MEIVLTRGSVVKKSSVRILQGAGLGDWLKSLQKSITGGKPSINKNDEQNFKKFQAQSQHLLQELSKTVAEMKKLGLENWGVEGESGKTTLENAVDHLSQFSEALNIAPEIVHEKPSEEVK